MYTNLLAWGVQQRDLYFFASFLAHILAFCAIFAPFLLCFWVIFSWSDSWTSVFVYIIEREHHCWMIMAVFSGTEKVNDIKCVKLCCDLECIMPNLWWCISFVLTLTGVGDGGHMARVIYKFYPTQRARSSDNSCSNTSSDACIVFCTHRTGSAIPKMH